ncbi:serine/threonine-protein phosphatase 7 long form homolog [Vicia villosa]|uniref:serine/threonine-protein phosphatase 7 long form homolog n=1 Tax=Vicia villosa TaxID=3911 RepID=UPI00273C8BEC|nr:serine/threonine-protein phosphatase 7 long form homolog [Vicia villosa]
MGQEHRGTIANIADFDITRFRTRAGPMNAPDPLIVDYVKRAGFGEVMNLTESKVDMKFILALCERWRPETHTFHLPMGECTVTLEDVYMLLGLKTNGKAVYGNVQQPNALCVELLGVDLIEGEGRQRGRGQGIKLAGLQLAYDDLKLNEFSDEESILQKTRMYIMLLFGKFLFPEGTGNSVNFMYLCLLGDIDAIKTYSWGSAVLAYLYSSLCKCAKKNSCTFSGCAFLLQAWAWWRMPVLAPANPNSFAFPYASRFNAIGLDYTNTPLSKIIFYRQLLDRLGPQDFIWRPYLELDHVPDLDEAAIWTTKSPIIRFTTVEMHQSDRVKLQFGMHQGIPDPPEPDCLGRWHLAKVSEQCFQMLLPL